jgi:hypothetical protein
MTASPSCLRLLVHWIRRAASRAAYTAGNSRAIKTAMMAITTSNSINVNPRRCMRNSVAVFLGHSVMPSLGYIKMLRHEIIANREVERPPVQEPHRRGPVQRLAVAGSPSELYIKSALFRFCARWFEIEEK